MKLLVMKEKYLKFVKATLSNGTYRSYYHHLKVIVNYFIDNDLKINKESLVLFIQDQKVKQLTNKTINHRIICFKAMLKYNGYESDCYLIKKLKATSKPFNYLDQENIKILKKYVLETKKLSEMNKLAILMLLDTGVRLRELINIEVNNIDLKNRIILLTETKNKDSRYVFYTELTEKYLLENIDYESKYLFKYKERGVYKIFYRIKKDLPFTKFHPHMLRHTCATNLLKNGADLESVRRIMGHREITQTQQYLHLDLDYIKSVYDRCMI